MDRQTADCEGTGSSKNLLPARVINPPPLSKPHRNQAKATYLHNITSTAAHPVTPTRWTDRQSEIRLLPITRSC